MATLKQKVEDLTERLERIEKRLGIAPLKGLHGDFKFMFSHLDHRTIEQILQGESDFEIAGAFLGEEKSFLETLGKSISKARWKHVLEEMKNMMAQGVFIGTSKHFQENLLRKIQRMEARGEIVTGAWERPVIRKLKNIKNNISGVPFQNRKKLNLSNWKIKVFDNLMSLVD